MVDQRLYVSEAWVNRTRIFWVDRLRLIKQTCVLPFRGTPPEPGAALLRDVANAPRIAPPNKGSISTGVYVADAKLGSTHHLARQPAGPAKRPDQIRQQTPQQTPAQNTNAFATQRTRRAERKSTVES